MRITSLTDYCLLGKSGLRVSPLCLGTDTFGTVWHGNDKETARALFGRYIECGGNFIDTADVYQRGQSEEWVGKLIKETGSRDSVVIGTKFTGNTLRRDPNAGGNGRKNIYRAIEASLQRLGTDYIDIYWMHAWDGITPVEEVISTMDNLIARGKIRYFGFSNVPAWYLSKAHSIGELRAYAPAIAVQLEYSLVERNIEREHIPAALDLGLGVCPWSPLATGLLSGKYSRKTDGFTGNGRLREVAANGDPIYQKFTERNWKVVETLADVSKEMGYPPAQVALNWITKRPGVTSAIIGASNLTQLNANLSALDFEIAEEHWRRLDAISKPEAISLYEYFKPGWFQNDIRGGVNILKEPPWYRQGS